MHGKSGIRLLFFYNVDFLFIMGTFPGNMECWVWEGGMNGTRHEKCGTHGRQAGQTAELDVSTEII